MNFDEYETLPSSNVIDHMMAGAIAGIMEHCVMYPLDSVKVSVLINHVYVYLESISLHIFGNNENSLIRHIYKMSYCTLNVKNNDREILVIIEPKITHKSDLAFKICLYISNYH